MHMGLGCSLTPISTVMTSGPIRQPPCPEVPEISADKPLVWGH